MSLVGAGLVSFSWGCPSFISAVTNTLTKNSLEKKGLSPLTIPYYSHWGKSRQELEGRPFCYSTQGYLQLRNLAHSQWSMVGNADNAACLLASCFACGFLTQFRNLPREWCCPLCTSSPISINNQNNPPKTCSQASMIQAIRLSSQIINSKSCQIDS